MGHTVSRQRERMSDKYHRELERVQHIVEQVQQEEALAAAQSSLLASNPNSMNSMSSMNPNSVLPQLFYVSGGNRPYSASQTQNMLLRLVPSSQDGRLAPPTPNAQLVFRRQLAQVLAESEVVEMVSMMGFERNAVRQCMHHVRARGIVIVDPVLLINAVVECLMNHNTPLSRTPLRPRPAVLHAENVDSPDATSTPSTTTTTSTLDSRQYPGIAESGPSNPNATISLAKAPTTSTSTAPNNTSNTSVSDSKSAAGDTVGRPCRICLDKPINTVVLRCGHMAMCLDCAQNLDTCPLCRRPIVEIVKTYIA